MDTQRVGRVVIAGGSGYLGQSLARHLSALGAEVTILSRRAPPQTGPWAHVQWDARTLGDWADALDGAAGLVNLAGRTVDCIKTPDRATRSSARASRQPARWGPRSTACAHARACGCR